MNRLFTVLVVLIILMGNGCSSAGYNPIVINELVSSRIQQSNHFQFGFWQFTVDPSEGTLDVVTLRMCDLHLNALRFLEPPVYLYLTVESFQFNGNILEADIGLRHPFLGLHQYTGFDVRGILISNGAVSGFTDPGLVMTGPGDTRLLNPDGYTRWWNPAEFPHNGTMFGYTDGLLGHPDSVYDFNSTLNAYKLFCDDLTDPDSPVDDISVSSRCVFSAGAQNVRHYTIEIGNSGFIFNYAVDASWKKPQGSPPYDVPDDFPPEANCPEAWNAIVVETDNTLWNDGTSSGGSLSLDVELWDHYGATFNDLYVESPGNFDSVGPIYPNVVSQHAASYDVEIPSATPEEGSIDILIIAESDTTGYQGLLPGKPVSTYFIYTAKVGSGPVKIDPVAVAEIVSEPPFKPGNPVIFNAANSYDPDGGDIMNYEWDFNSDANYGDPYDSGTDENPTKIFNDPGIYFINVRVTDDESDTDTLNEPLILHVSGGDDYIWVDDDAVEPYLGTFDNPFPTIEMGVVAANANYPDFSHIMVKDGTYQEEVFISSGNLIVEGYSTPGPLIVSPDDATHDLIAIGTDADDTTLKHFRIMPRTDMRGIYACGSNQIIDDIEFIDNPGGPTCSHGIYVGSWVGTGNVINNVRVNGYHMTGNGFIYAACEDMVVTNCVLLNITFDGPSGLEAISVNGNTASGSHPDMLVAKNVIGHIRHAMEIDDYGYCRGMRCSNVEGATIRNNLVFDIDSKYTNGWTWGVDIDNAMDVTVEHNTISGIQGPKWIFGFNVEDMYADPSGVTHRDHIVTDLVATGSIQAWRWAYMGKWDGTPLMVHNSCAYEVGLAFCDSEDVTAGFDFIESNPQFVDKNSNDYRVTPGSPASGTAHDGTDMGAYGGSDPLTWLPD